MALVLRSNTDLVYLPDHGFVGEEGALRILNHLQANTVKLDVSHNLLSTGGVVTLVKGLAHVRQRFSSDTSRIWTLGEINMAFNAVGDEGLESVLGWAKKDLGCRKLMLQGNDIKVKAHLDGILNNLSSSRLSTLSLTNNPIDIDGLASFLGRLEANELTELHLSTCKLPPKAAECIAEFVGASRCRNLVSLELNGNHLGAEGVRTIVDAIEKSNYGIRQVGLFANEEYPRTTATGDDEDTRMTPREGYDPVQEAKELHHLVHERLPELVFRNVFLTRRVRRAALRTLVPARILLNAQHVQPLSDEDTAKHVMAELAAITLNSPSTPAPRPFPILDLPPEILHLVIRHCSQDPYALSERQFVQLRTHAESRESLNRLVKRRKERMVGIYAEGVMKDKEQEIKDDWLKSGRWDKWELNTPTAM